jgi:SRSO17 transposase
MVANTSIAQQILEKDTLVRASDITHLVDQAAQFLERYKPLLWRAEQRNHLQVYIQGLCSSLERKSIEPIATLHGLYRRPLQRFIGDGKWSDSRVRNEMGVDIVAQIGDPNGVLVIDGSGNPKSGSESVGVERQWLGRLGKVDNCQVGVYLAYSARGSRVLVDGDLYLPESWATDDSRRAKTHVPDQVEFRTSWQIANDLLLRHAPKIPHTWTVGDDEFGRPKEFRDALADRGERYLLEVPSATAVRKPAHWPGSTTKWRAVKKRKQSVPAHRWQCFKIRDGEKGPIEVLAYYSRRDQTRSWKAA